MKMSNTERRLTQEFISLARQKKYHEEDIKMLLMISCCDQVKETGLSPEDIMREFITMCKQSKTGAECLTHALALAGYDETAE